VHFSDKKRLTHVKQMALKKSIHHLTGVCPKTGILISTAPSCCAFSDFVEQAYKAVWHIASNILTAFWPQSAGFNRVLRRSWRKADVVP
jgi:hypothetical protein